MRIRFRLRSLLLIVSVFAIVVGPWMYRCTTRKANLDRLSEHGYNISYRPTNKFLSWLGERIGNEFVTTPLGLYCNGGARAQPDLDTVARLPEIQKLVLSVADVNDQELAKIAKLPNVDFIVLNDTDVTDAGIGHLVDMPLVSMDLTGLPLTDECVQHLSAIATLRDVALSANTITDEGRQRLASVLPKCNIRIKSK